jgi:hypothetical protein
MSKKLIAVASAAALALSALVAVPAGAAAGDVTISGETNSGPTINGATSTLAYKVDVPEDNEFAGAQDDYLTVAVTPTASNATVSASSTGSVEILTTAEFDDTTTVASTATGKQTFSANAVGTADVEFYVYTTSTSAGTLVVKAGDSTKTYYIKGNAGTANSISVKFPTSLNSSTASNVDVTVKDVFGNDITGSSGDEFNTDSDNGETLTTNTVGAAATVDPDAFTWNTTRKVWAGKVIGVSGGGASSMTITLDNGGFDAEDDGLAAPSLVAFSSVSAADLATQVTTLTAQVAALILDYNALVAKWNKKVADKKAPKKKVASK